MKDRNGIIIFDGVSATGIGGEIKILRYDPQRWRQKKTLAEKATVCRRLVCGYVNMARQLAIVALNRTEDRLYWRARLLGKSAYAMRQATHAESDLQEIEKQMEERKK